MTPPVTSQSALWIPDGSQLTDWRGEGDTQGSDVSTGAAILKILQCTLYAEEGVLGFGTD